MQKRKLQGLLKRFKQGQNVQNRDLQTWLGEDGYAHYEQEWAAQKELRDELSNKPDAIIEYERRLKRANFTYNRADSYSQLGKHSTARRIMVRAQGEFERLQEIIAADPSLVAWFDRDTSWTWDGELNIDPDSVPQVVTSKSLRNRAPNGGLKIAKVCKKALKSMVIEQALAGLEQDADVSALLAKRRKLKIADAHPEKDCD